MTTEDFIIALFIRIDDVMKGMHKHSQASLYPSEIVTLFEGSSGAIKQGSASNLLRVERNGSSIKAYANGALLVSLNDGYYTGTRYVGLVAWTYDVKNVDARFDNFAVYAEGCWAGSLGEGKAKTEGAFQWNDLSTTPSRGEFLAGRSERIVR